MTLGCDTLDSRLSEAGLIDLVKIDVEGAEQDVLGGPAALVDARRLGKRCLRLPSRRRLPAVQEGAT